MSFSMDLTKFSKKLELMAPQTVKRIGDDLYREIIERTPVRTGYLKSRWIKEANINYTLISNDAPYAIYVEEGTSKMAPHYMVKSSLKKIEVDIDRGKYKI